MIKKALNWKSGVYNTIKVVIFINNGVKLHSFLLSLKPDIAAYSGLGL